MSSDLHSSLLPNEPAGDDATPSADESPVMTASENAARTDEAEPAGPSDAQLAELEERLNALSSLGEAATAEVAEHEAAPSTDTMPSRVSDLLRETPAPTASDAGDESDGLRSQLAEMFGVDMQELRAHSAVDPNEPEVEEVVETPREPEAHVEPVVDETPEEPVEVAEPAAPQEEESVAAYMERLLARSRSTEPSSPTPSKTEAKKPAPKPTPSDVPEMPSLEQTTQPIVTARDRRVRKPVDKEKLRQEVSSLRALALASSRAAVAKSRRKAMKDQLFSKAVVAGVAGFVSCVLLASPVWSNESFVLYGAIGILLTAGFAYNFATTYRTYRQKIREATAEEKAANDEIVRATAIAAGTTVEQPRADAQSSSSSSS